MQTKRPGGSISAPNSKCRRTTRQQSKAEKETTKLPGHVPLSSSSSEMSSIKGSYPIWKASRSTYSCDSTLRSYVRGKSPKLSVPWWRCDYVYIPVNNGGTHWLAACVDLKARHIDLYDPNMGNKYV
nr:uncharacterized protein LOC125418495 [Ziziphus jujuba var. spinosa]